MSCVAVPVHKHNTPLSLPSLTAELHIAPSVLLFECMRVSCIVYAHLSLNAGSGVQRHRLAEQGSARREADVCSSKEMNTSRPEPIFAVDGVRNENPVCVQFHNSLCPCALPSAEGVSGNSRLCSINATEGGVRYGNGVFVLGQGRGAAPTSGLLVVQRARWMQIQRTASLLDLTAEELERERWRGGVGWWGGIAAAYI